MKLIITSMLVAGNLFGYCDMNQDSNAFFRCMQLEQQQQNVERQLKRQTELMERQERRMQQQEAGPMWGNFYQPWNRR